MSEFKWDVFISHASEDKSSVATPLAALFSNAGLQVWIDSHELRLGDSLISKINEGLADSKYGLVILSTSFLAKEWPKRELAALLSIELKRGKRILPVLHNLQFETLLADFPLIADKLCISTTVGLEIVATEICRAVGINLDLSPTPSRPLLTQEKFSDEKIGILRLANSDPFYRPRDIVIKLTNKELFIDCPDEIKEEILEIDEEFCFNQNTSFNSSDFEDIANSTEISDLPNLINKHRKIIGQEFLEKLKSRLPIFNGRKFGIYEIHFSNTSDMHEYPTARLRVFTTDYFTHRVFRSIFSELKNNDHPIAKVGKYDISKYHPFTTSLGINAFVLLRPSNQIVLAKRSIFVANTEKPVWHVSVNEGLSQTDIESRQVSLIKCVLRGLNEELGVREERVEEIKFYNFFMVKRNFEIGITALVEADLSFDYLVHLYENAKDSVLETEEITGVPFELLRINNFFEENHESFSNIAIHSLRVLLSKELF
jgi:hypothetical protein